ncbi:LamG domain-containing protein [Jiangella asiatica]|uniref:LamG domain-containing protein n=1 Tax=Jiangella asiatica TaxID=2530372 RepID=UPI0013A5CA5D|nr:LamG domain-containing protein [Jiangella asiatica]
MTRRWLHVEPRVAMPGLVAAWPCDEGSGYAFRDVTGNGHTLYVIGSRWNTSDSGLISSFRRQGRRGGGVHLDGTRWLQAQHTPALDAGGALTVSVWVRPAELPEAEVSLLALPGQWSVGLTAAGAIRWTVVGTDGNPRTAQSPDQAVVAGRWAHVAATANAHSGRLIVFVHGSRVRVVDVPAFTPAGTGDDLMVGEGLVGDVDEPALFDRALGAVAVEQLYLVGVPQLYTQTRETIDAKRSEWTRFKGSEPIPHPVDTDTVFSARFDGSAVSDQGAEPVRGTASFRPGRFGAALAGSDDGIGYASPLAGSDGTFEAWYVPTGGNRGGELFRAAGAHGWLSLSLVADRWRADLGTGEVTTHTVTGPAQRLVTSTLEHVAVAWGDSGGDRLLTLHLNGVDVASVRIGSADTRFDRSITIGGTAGCVVDDVHISDRARGWGEVCPRGHASTDAAGLDLRDGFGRPDGTIPLWWRPGGSEPLWTQATRDWEDVAATQDDPHRHRALYCPADATLHTVFHPDMYGVASSIEAGLAFGVVADGWAGVFVQATEPTGALSGYAFTINPGTDELRLARYADGEIAEHKTLDYDFEFRPEATYTLTLTSAGDGVLRGFVDGHNLISMRTGDQPLTRGHAGLLAHGVATYFDDVHFTALTPAAAESREIQARVLTFGDRVAYDDLSAQPFRWHKRHGLVPWRYQTKNPEPPGLLVGAYTDDPPRPIPAAFWRSGDSANSDLNQIDGRILYFMRGGGERGDWSYGGRIGVLDTTVDQFDGIHFNDRNRDISDLESGTFLQGNFDPHYPDLQDRFPRFNLNPALAVYAGDGRMLVFVHEMRPNDPDFSTRYRVIGYGYYDVRADDWIDHTCRHVPWSSMDPTDPDAQRTGILGGPEVVGLRDPDTDEYRIVLYYQSTNADGHQAMTTVGMVIDADGVPQLDPERPAVTSLTRTGTDANGRERATKAMYGFMVLFDNGIYYNDYCEGPQVPDWPTHFPLCAALDPYAGPWVRNEDTNHDDATYFRRGTEFEPDNAAIWQAAKFKHRGRYYTYYETIHAIENVDAPYQHYDHRHVGSRVGYATAMGT